MSTTIWHACIATVFLFNINVANALSVIVKDSSGANLADVVVYAEPLEQQPLGKTKKNIVISQAKKSFTPYISVAQTGNSIVFSNKDDITHHIYSASGSKFAFLIRPGQKVGQPKLSQSNEIVMGCNIHDWMSGYLLVLDTPYFTKTDANGLANLDIKGAGRYKIIVWHPQITEKNNRISKDINIAEDLEVAMSLSQKMDKILEQKSDDDFDFLSDY
ncbi:MAG: hypothetical protein V7784_01110 [Oceanospirillaceae bacterium]